jgi:hypothetical protein
MYWIQLTLTLRHLFSKNSVTLYPQTTRFLLFKLSFSITNTTNTKFQQKSKDARTESFQFCLHKPLNEAMCGDNAYSRNTVILISSLGKCVKPLFLHNNAKANKAGNISQSYYYSLRLWNVGKKIIISQFPASVR